jgi:hypothetical protein
VRVAIIGGEKSLVEGNWSRRLEENGLELVVHHHDKNRAKMIPIPQSAEGIIVIRDMTRHRMSEPAKEEADKRGLPYAAVPRKWSKAEPILRMQGILPEATDNVVAPVKDRHDVVLTYIVAARSDGRIPKIDECRGVLKRAFGPNAKLGSKEYTRLANEAAQQQMLVEEQEPQDTTSEDAYEWAETLLLDKPELLLDEQDFVQQVIALMDGRAGDQRIQRGVKDARSDMRERWKTDAQTREDAIFGFLKRWWMAWRDEGKTYPHTRKVRDACTAIFGFSYKLEQYRQARVAVLGEWADSLLELGPAQLLLNGKLPGCDLRVLLESGAIKGFQVEPDNVKRSGRWYTSAEAIDEYVKAQDQMAITKPEPPAPEPQKVEPPAPEPEPVPKITADNLLDQIQKAITESVKAAIKEVTVDVEVKPEVKVEIELTEVKSRLDSIENTLQSLTESLTLLTDEVSKLNERQGSQGFGEAVEALADAVSKRGVGISLTPAPVSRD